MPHRCTLGISSRKDSSFSRRPVRPRVTVERTTALGSVRHGGQGPRGGARDLGPGLVWSHPEGWGGRRCPLVRTRQYATLHCRARSPGVELAVALPLGADTHFTVRVPEQRLGVLRPLQAPAPWLRAACLAGCGHPVPVSCSLLWSVPFPRHISVSRLFSRGVLPPRGHR